MELDYDIRRMATELQATSLLARISVSDLIVIEAKYNFKCLSAFKIGTGVLRDPSIIAPSKRGSPN